jgi:hypothetical protein
MIFLTGLEDFSGHFEHTHTKESPETQKKTIGVKQTEQ